MSNCNKDGCHGCSGSEGGEVSLEKKYRTRDGDEVVLTGIKGAIRGGNYPVCGKIYNRYNRTWAIEHWTSTGKYDTNVTMGHLDLVEIEEEKEMKISMDKTYRTENGKDVRIYAVDGGGTHPVHGAIFNDYDNAWGPFNWQSNGVFTAASGDAGYNLVEVKPSIKVKRYIAVYGEHSTEVFHTLEEAKDTDPKAIITVDEEVEEGYGL